MDDQFIYVSNVNGDPQEHDGNGYISRLYPNGEVDDNEFIKGLDAPQGLVVVSGVIYTPDTIEVLGFDLRTRKKVFECRFLKNHTNFLNDICSDGKGNLFVTATDINEICQINILTKPIIPL